MYSHFDIQLYNKPLKIKKIIRVSKEVFVMEENFIVMYFIVVKIKNHLKIRSLKPNFS